MPREGAGGLTSFVEACLPFALFLEPESRFDRSFLALAVRVLRRRGLDTVFVIVRRLGENYEKPVTSRHDAEDSFPMWDQPRTHRQ